MELRPLFVSCILARLMAIVTSHGSHATSHGSAVHQHRAANTGQGFHDANVVQDAEHIGEHLEDLHAAINVSAMTAEELEFHYFRMHDYDNNTKLDGLEIYKALTHLLPYNEVEESEDLANKDRDGQKNMEREKGGQRDRGGEQTERERKQKETLFYTDIVDNVL